MISNQCDKYEATLSQTGVNLVVKRDLFKFIMN